MPNSSWASMTSSPLFISVLESIVIFGPIAQVGWARACVDGDVGELGGGSAAERSAAGGEQHPGDLAVDRDRRAQALVHRAVLAVDRDQLGAGRRPQRLHDRAGGDEALLVGQGEPLALLERGDRDREAGEADHRVDDDVGRLDEVREAVDDGREGQRGGDLGPAHPGRRRRPPWAGTPSPARRARPRRTRPRAPRSRTAAPRPAPRRGSACRSSRTNRRRQRERSLHLGDASERAPASERPANGLRGRGTP